jgi:hypothetical protein
MQVLLWKGWYVWGRESLMLNGWWVSSIDYSPPITDQRGGEVGIENSVERRV